MKDFKNGIAKFIFGLLAPWPLILLMTIMIGPVVGFSDLLKVGFFVSILFGFLYLDEPDISVDEDNEDEE